MLLAGLGGLLLACSSPPPPMMAGMTPGGDLGADSGPAPGPEPCPGLPLTNSGVLDLDLRMPAELGGDGQGTNPEQLFAAGFAACFHGALSLVARQEELDPAPISVAA